MNSSGKDSKKVPVTSRSGRREAAKQRKHHRARRILLGIIGTVVVLFGLMVVAGVATPWGRNLRLIIAETIISTRHYQWARYITTGSEYRSLLKQLSGAGVINTGVSDQIHVAGTGSVQIDHIAQSGWNGWVMFVHNPKLLRLVQAQVHNGEGEYITDMAPRVGAVAGTNASGFEDPNGSGWGGYPVGLEYVNGRVINSMKVSPSWTTVGFTRDGVMVMGQYSLWQLQNMGVRDAMQFHPELVVNGKPMITQGNGGWGYGPRTAIGQTRDGTVILIIINGRLRAGSLGASQRQVQDLMLHYGAVNACAMDGGSSSVLYNAHKILNAPSTIDPKGERHLPDAWLVFPTEQAANAYGS